MVAVIYQTSIETSADSGVKPSDTKAHVWFMNVCIRPFPAYKWAGDDKCGGWKQSAFKYVTTICSWFSMPHLSTLELHNIVKKTNLEVVTDSKTRQEEENEIVLLGSLKSGIKEVRNSMNKITTAVSCIGVHNWPPSDFYIFKLYVCNIHPVEPKLYRIISQNYSIL